MSRLSAPRLLTLDAAPYFACSSLQGGLSGSAPWRQQVAQALVAACRADFRNALQLPSPLRSTTLSPRETVSGLQLSALPSMVCMVFRYIASQASLVGVPGAALPLRRLKRGPQTHSTPLMCLPEARLCALR